MSRRVASLAATKDMRALASARALSFTWADQCDQEIMRQPLQSRDEIKSDTPLRLAIGETRTYYYAWRRDPRTDAQPGTPDFIRCYQEAT
jgi:hypothetical protein